jgi:hypothetical protein
LNWAYSTSSPSRALICIIKCLPRSCAPSWATRSRAPLPAPPPPPPSGFGALASSSSPASAVPHLSAVAVLGRFDSGGWAAAEAAAVAGRLGATAEAAAEAAVEACSAGAERSTGPG